MFRRVSCNARVRLEPRRFNIDLVPNFCLPSGTRMVTNINFIHSVKIPQPFGEHQISKSAIWSVNNRPTLATEAYNNHTALYSCLMQRDYSTQSAPNTTPKAEEIAEEKPLSKKEQVKKAFKEYGSTVIIFHVALSLASLGGCYLLVLNGLDVVAIIQKLGIESEKLATISNASTFVVAYAFHKVFSPVRLSITLFSTPIIVRYLRAKGILKMPVKANKLEPTPTR